MYKRRNVKIASMFSLVARIKNEKVKYDKVK